MRYLSDTADRTRIRGPTTLQVLILREGQRFGTIGAALVSRHNFDGYSRGIRCGFLDYVGLRFRLFSRDRQTLGSLDQGLHLFPPLVPRAEYPLSENRTFNRYDVAIWALSVRWFPFC